jgi:hypothetical protein
MMRHKRLDHVFVEYLPESMDPGKLYVSMSYATAAHQCCCGCGQEVVTPLTPTDWKLTFDGESISLHPSIGNWDFPCRSHYVIDRGRIMEADPWSDEQLAKERTRDQRAKASYYGVAETPAKASASTKKPEAQLGKSLWSSIQRLWGRR